MDAITPRLTELYINGQKIPQDNVEEVLPPAADTPFWQIQLKGGVVIYATGNVAVYCNPPL